METASECVLHFLDLMAERQLDAAEALMAPGAKITFPGGKRYGSQREMVAAAQGRYQWVKKQFDRVDALSTAAGEVVYVLGTLYGVNRHGVPFAGIRYVDRFVLCEGLITSQEVWNDLAESGVLEKRQP